MFCIIQSLYNNLGNVCITKQFISVQIYIVKEQCQTLKNEMNHLSVFISLLENKENTWKPNCCL